MKYKVLLTGKNEAAIDDFFRQMSERFDFVTTSTRYTDISNHLSFFRPDVFVYCLNNESRDDLTQIANLNFRLTSAKVPLVVFGLKEDCDEFMKIGPYTASLTLHRPMPVSAIQDKIMALVKNRRFTSAVDSNGNDNVPRASSFAASTSSTLRQPDIFMSKNSAFGQPDMSMSSAFGQSDISMPRKSASGGRKLILVVDDNAVMLKTLKEHLHDQYDVATAPSGRVAMKFLERKQADLILLDYEMPDESGPTILEGLRASEMTRDIPVIFLTGVTDMKKIKEALALKPQNYLLKPVNREKLLDTIARTIG